MYLVAAILKNGRHFEFRNFFRWLTGFIKRAISKEYVCQFWCLFPEMKDSYDILLLSAPLFYAERICRENKIADYFPEFFFPIFPRVFFPFLSFFKLQPI